MSEDSDKMSINVYTKYKDTIMESKDSSTEYILKMNETMNNSVVNMKVKIKDLRNKIDDLETTNDKHDSSIRYMKGMLKNYVELIELYNTILTKKESINKINQKESDFYACQNNKFVNAYVMMFLLYIFNNMFYVYNGFLDIRSVCKSAISIIICTLASCETFKIFRTDFKFQHDNIKSINISIKECKTKIKEIENSSDFMSEFIDGF